ncbi:hypothetical protein C2S53_019713 [Perilla frutescens var. hirtella]|uniref:MADS-box domain-containing protein n=1 Tax=Perilla frutescens var. hirtella TaxID=608512 RepID=A0AAD4J0T7_PERFH|nr:hypothetical protein C2S53_019713 [Perilla frutescens var. hirtella]
MARKKVEIKPIEVKSKRHITFSKRRGGLFKKTEDYCKLANAKAAVIIFSNAGNGFGFGHPSVKEVLDRYLADHPSASDEIEEVDSGVVDGGAIDMAEAAQLTEMETRFSEAMATALPAWDLLMSDLGLRELGELEETMRNIKSLTAERVKEMVADGGGFPARKEEHSAC